MRKSTKCYRFAVMREPTFKTIIEPHRVKVDRADPHDHARRARAVAARCQLQPVQPALRRRDHRSVDRQRNVRDERRTVGGRDARRRILRGQPELLSLRSRGARHLRLPPRVADAPGPRSRAHLVRCCAAGRPHRAGQHALRHHAREHRGGGRASARLAMRGSGAAERDRIRSRATSTSARSSACSNSTTNACRW